MTEPQSMPQDEETPETAPVPEQSDSQAELARMKDQLLRALAEAENTRRRAQKEREDTGKYAVANFAREMLTVADNFRRALDAVPQEARGNEALKNLITGIEATERQLQAALERFGIKKLEPLDQTFDPNFHRVMMEIDDPDKAPGTVVQVLQPGYIIHDRLLREALVAVAKGAGPAMPKVDTSA
ncbi:MAG: nucleotide exchange factor GrpE [Bdellovibrionales bacterium]